MAPNAACAYAAEFDGSGIARFSPSIIGGGVCVVHARRSDSEAGVTSFVMPGGRGRPPGFHHVSSVELPPMRIVGAPLPRAASVCTSRAKIGLGRVAPR